MKLVTNHTITIYWNHSRRYLGTLVILLLGIAGGVCAETYSPVLYKHFFDAAASGGSANALLHILFKILVAGAVGWIFWRIATVTNTYFQLWVMRDLYKTCFTYLQDHSYRFFSDNFAGSLVRKVTKYSSAYEKITDQIFWSIVPTSIRMTIIIGILYARFPLIAWVLFLWTIMYVGFNYAFSTYKLTYDTHRSEMDTKAVGFLADTISNNINLKIFANQKLEKKSFEQVIFEWTSAQLTSWNLANISEAVQSAMIVMLEVGVIYTALKFWQKGQLTVGDFAMIQTYVLQMFSRLWEVGRNIRRIYEGFSDSEEMTNILITPHEIVDIKDAQELQVPHGTITFNHTAFRYNKDRTVLEDFSLVIPAGQKVALVGPSGGGKTTLVKLLLRFFDIQEGSIAIDGTDIAKVTQNSLRKQIALVPQEPILFHRTLMENIRYARPDAADNEVIEAAKLAHCHEFISRFPEGYETFVGERGVKLSGGERQRVAIARAILKNAPILVLDEATSSLDSESEHLIQDALKNLMKNKTTIVIAHRLSTIMQMDRIIVLEGGKITEDGKHDELLKAKQGTYQKLWHIQAGGFA